MDHTREHREKISASLRGGTQPPEVRRKISASLRGHPVSGETRDKIRAALLGIKRSAETRAKMSTARRGLTQSTTTRAKRADALRGRQHTDEARLAFRAGRRAGRADAIGYSAALDDIGYSGMHDRLRATLPKVCADCGRTDGRLEVSLNREALSSPDSGVRAEWRSGKYRGRYYTTDARFYSRRCPPCHIRYDRANGRTDAGARPAAPV